MLLVAIHFVGLISNHRSLIKFIPLMIYAAFHRELMQQ